MTEKITDITHSRSLPLLSLGIKSYFSTWAIMRIGQIHSMNLLGFILFLIVFYFYAKTTPCLKKKEVSVPPSLGFSFSTIPCSSSRLLTGVFSFTFTLLYLAGSYRTIIFDVSNPLFQVVLLAATFMGLYFLLFRVLLFLASLTSVLPGISSLGTDTRGFSVFLSFLERHRKKLPLLCFTLCVLVRIPFFLYSYPGIMTPDSINQLEQVLGMKPYSNHHPWIHTMIISFFYHLGTLFTDNRNLALAFYTIFQILYMAFAFSYLLKVLLKYVKSTGLLFSLMLIYAFLPYHSVMAICIWKDIMFSATVLIFSSALFDLIMVQHKSKKEKDVITLKENFPCLVIYFMAGIFFCLLRSNGWYAFMLTLPFLLISFWKSKKLLYPLHLLLILLVLFTKGPVMNHFDVVQPDFVESLSIPLQQVGRVIATGGELLPQEQELLGKIMECEHIPALYREYISDPMKELVRAGNPRYLEKHKTEYFKLWLTLGLRYPGIYLEAYIEQTKGFYSPSAVYPVAETDGIIDSDTGFTRDYLLRGKAVVKLREILLKLHQILPLYGSLWSMGSLLWSLLILLYLKLTATCSEVGFAQGKSPRKLPEKDTLPLSLITIFTLWLPSLSIIATLLLATPVATEFRYAYHLACCLPLYLGIVWSKSNY